MDQKTAELYQHRVLGLVIGFLKRVGEQLVAERLLEVLLGLEDDALQPLVVLLREGEG